MNPNLGFARLGSGLIGPVPVPVLIAAVFAASWFVLKRPALGRGMNWTRLPPLFLAVPVVIRGAVIIAAVLLDRVRTARTA